MLNYQRVNKMNIKWIDINVSYAENINDDMDRCIGE